jgi:ribosomal protein S18 acetylase RimI-like enzyme
MISIRPANESDVETLCSLDLIAVHDDERRDFIKRSIASGTCYVAVAGNEVIGYGVLDYTFFGNGSIEMLYVDSNNRRRGAGEALYDTWNRCAKSRKCSSRPTSRTLKCSRCSLS